MENQPMQGNRPSNPRRRTRSKMQVFKEVYLPFLILAVAVIVIVGIIIAIAAGGGSSDSTGGSTPPSQSAQLQAEAEALIEQAAQLALQYDYDGALALLESFSGEISDFPALKEAVDHYTVIKHTMVSWEPSQVPNLSFHVLVADLSAALADPTYGENGNNRYNRNFVTVDEFNSILKRLYDNGYVLVSLSDFYEYSYSESIGQLICTEKQLLLPQGKKPILLTQTHCNYYTYMVDPDRDGQPDKNGAGFASKLCWDNGFYNEMVNTKGETVTGAFDLVPLLENFLLLHPDFSYKGARAILAFSGYDGVFGYRINSEALSSAERAQAQADAAALLQKLKDTGYSLACYTYDNADYSVKSAEDIAEDIQKWQTEIAPLTGPTNILVFAQEADIGTSYENNEKFDVLYENGFRFFLGSTPFLSQEVDALYVRHNRLMVTGSTLRHHGDWFSEIFDTNDLLDPRRTDIPE